MSRATIILAQKITVQTFPTSKFKTLAPRNRHAQNTHLNSLASSSKQHSDMSHFGRSGPPDIRDTFSVLVLNITFRTTADDLFPLFDKYGKVVDVFIPRDRRTGESRGFAFVRYKYADEAQKAVDKLDGRVVDGREIMVQFAKYGPNAERIRDGRIVESTSKIKSRSRSRSPRPKYRDGYRDRDRDYRRRSRSRSRDRYERDGYRGRDKDYHRRSVSCSPDRRKDRGRGYDEERRSRSRSHGSPNSPRSPPCKARLRDESPNGHNDNKHSPTSKSISHDEPEWWEFCSLSGVSLLLLDGSFCLLVLPDAVSVSQVVSVVFGSEWQLAWDFLQLRWRCPGILQPEISLLVANQLTGSVPQEMGQFLG
ncbi:hypothetical protein NC651_005792 [Populus alba x Populus x berolinensis]|nr:hypothetical protein NC651_005792 [Populus alba x Populus x berolinensis]